MYDFFTPSHPKMKFYVVGGYVRDMIMGLQSDDVDFSVEAESFDALLQYVKSVADKVYSVDEEYFTVLAMIDGAKYDFVLCRKDGEYSDGRHPDSVQMGTIFDDLARRDFTMNAIALDLETGEYLDPYDGRLDISDGIIKGVGDVRERFLDDPLRILRAYRFSVTKDMEIAGAVFDCLWDEGMYAILERANPNRIFAEIRKAFKHDALRAMEVIINYPLLVKRCAELGVSIVPSLRERDN